MTFIKIIYLIVNKLFFQRESRDVILKSFSRGCVVVICSPSGKTQHTFVPATERIK